MSREPVADATMLVVDDDDDVRRALARALGRLPCRLLEAADGAEGLRILEREPVQVVVSDHRMPGMSGVEFLRVVKERWPRVQRVLVAGRADTAAVEEAVNRSEVFRFLWKPWDDAHLVLTVQSAIDQHALVEDHARLASLARERAAELERLNGELAAQGSRAIDRAAEEWRTAFDAISDPLASLKDDGEVLRANAAFARMAGVPLHRLRGLLPSGGAFGTLPAPSLGAGSETVTEVSRAERTWLVRTFPFAEGASVVAWKDVTDERQMSRRLAHSAKMFAVGQLAAGVAHEINNPLGGILAFAQLMSREERSPEDLERLNHIIDAATRAKRIVESLLRFSRRPRQDERGEVDLARESEEALFLLQPQFKGGRVEVAKRLAPAICVGNANALRQIAVNLITNAAQAMRFQGRVAVETATAGGTASLRVTDSGPGIPPELADRIFEPFFTTKPEGQGTGLGLSVCYQIAEEHGGTIRHEPAPGGGASFVLEIPAAAAKG
jgi:two-component system NtrC family sensor kinase